jgi:ribose transport system ATP-binding protein
MLGRPLESLFPDSGSSVGDAVLKAKELSGPGLLEAMDVEIRAGEITGLAGQLGAGNTALLRLIAGFDKPSSGSITVDNGPVRPGSPAAAVRAGIVYCTDDRKRDGFFAERPLIENLSSLSLDALSEGPWMIRRREREFATEAARFLGIDERRMRASVSALSGGNQQKVVLGKLACRQPPPRVLLMNEPTRGVDVGARADIYQLIRKLADDGMGVAFASSDISEMMGLADRVVTFFRGRPVSVLAGDELDERRVILDVTHPRDSVK